MKFFQKRQVSVPKFEQVIIVIFALITLFMPLLYLPFNYFVIALIVLAAVFVIASRYRKTKRFIRIKEFVRAHPGLTIFLAALITRLACVAIITPQIAQVSDFGMVYQDSLSLIPTSEHSPILAHYLTYPFLLHFFVVLFGESTVVGGIVNAFLASGTILLTYLIGKAVVSKQVGVISATLLALWPAIAVFTPIYAPDHPTMILTLLSIFAFINLLQRKETRAKIIWAVISAVSMWSLGFFKDMAPILAIALIIVAILLIIRDGSWRKNLVIIGSIVGISLVVALSTMIRVPIISAIADRPTNPNIISYLIYTGLADNDTGSWRLTIADHYADLIEQNDYNYDKANSTMLHEALGNIKHRVAQIPTTLWNKNKTIQADDDAKIFWVQLSANADGSEGFGKALETILQPINRVYFAGIVLLLCVGIYFLFRERKYSHLISLVIVCIGYSLLLLVIEAQNRYRIIIEPLYCIIAAYGLFSIYNARATKKLLKTK